ncbi:SGNH/GDSL hydrolase family protein [Desulfobotulus sp. H1]|uniref:SGNH/GDSL hydrolase family protein n=1 Tax=Desulfobotulus pelophilus TaxID=2823377 RepID=A0ABT3N7E7_9BACT|nr:SGNH/GDSL hydrolase family protein [Desulfobotulus pelophilus]MCW7753383.1 SGNH/GDSL hydrolase family protein [Desulfobotulus pelophilus]
MAEFLLRWLVNLSLLFSPFFLVQGWWLCRTIPRLPEADGPVRGRVPGRAPGFHILLIGESTAAGVGAASQKEALAGQLAKASAERAGCEVFWQVLGRNGLTARDACTLVAGSRVFFSPDVVVLVLGVNDVVRMRSASVWRKDLRALISLLRRRWEAVPVVLAGVPPVGLFPALPQPLREILGLRGRMLDAVSRSLAEKSSGVSHAAGPVGVHPEPEFFCSDGFHPSPVGYAIWGRYLAEVLVPEICMDQ